MKIFEHKKTTSEMVTSGRFELEHEGQVASLAYTLSGQVLGLLHTDVPEGLRGTGVASSLVKSALDWARERQLKVDVTCPFVAGFLKTHPEYSDLVLG
jgi:predicted GNAT family acetyltransferase